MKIKEYAQEVQRTLPDLGSDLNNQLHMVIGIATEAGELLDVYKKHFAYGIELDKVNAGEEVGDIFWYAVNLAVMLGQNPEDIMETNINKLRVRFPEKFTQENAIVRNLNKEREILENGH